MCEEPKNYMRIQFHLLLMLFALSACSKNQQQVVKLDGKWNVTGATVQGFGETNPDLVYDFDFCKIKNGDFCDFSIHNFTTNEVTNGGYTVSDNGQTLSMTISDGFGFIYREYEIIKLSNSRLRLECYNTPQGELSFIELKAINE